ncbi:MAG: kinase [Candidatus Methanomethylophilaceae archaeon]|nr:kinase [Candidatus Methanomethylophilaceae archaeon]
MDGVHFRARAPLRIGLAGGGTDVDPYATEKGGIVLNTTINRYAYCTVSPTDNGIAFVHSQENGDSIANLGDGPLKLNKNELAEVVANHFDIRKGFSMDLHSEAPPGSGLGGSSTVIVSIISAMCRWIGHKMSGMEMAKLAYHLERKELGLKGGRQDQYAAVFGGFNLMEFNGDEVKVNPVHVDKDVINELQSRTLLCYTGTTRESADIIESQVDAFKKGDNERALDESKRIAVDMAVALRKGDIGEVGRLLHTSWEYKKQFSSKITNPLIDRMYNQAMEAGAIGGKVSGAGGGGFMFFVCGYNSKYNVAKAIMDANERAVIKDFMFEPAGVTSWRYPND